MEQEKILEAEIAELSKAIEAKRSALAAERGAPPAERAVVQAAVSDLTGGHQAVQATITPLRQGSAGQSYLETLDEASTARVNELIATIGEHGFKQAIAKAQQESPYILDAFHDALVTHLYEELKTRGLVK